MDRQRDRAVVFQRISISDVGVSYDKCRLSLPGKQESGEGDDVRRKTKGKQPVLTDCFQAGLSISVSEATETQPCSGPRAPGAEELADSGSYPEQGQKVAYPP